jgi:hypothetical protein
MVIRIFFIICLLTIWVESSLWSQDGFPKFLTVPERVPEVPKTKGERYVVPATKWEKRTVLWGWSCELADGTGLSFGGVDQLSDDGRPHTRIKNNGEWVSILAELQKKNPLQKFVEKTFAIRNKIKDNLSLIRNLYFEGKPEIEADAIADKIYKPIFKECVSEMQALQDELKKLANLDSYSQGQINLVLQRLQKSCEILSALDSKVSPSNMAQMRLAQIELEFAKEYLDCEPAGRALSKVIYHAQTNSYVIFGGDHMDYLTNDLWVYDVKAGRWFQRHQKEAPEVRADHNFEVNSEGLLVMFGGYSFEQKGYCHIGPERWLYDMNKNIWLADNHSEKSFSSSSRSLRYFPPAGPEHFMQGPRPDAAANELLLNATKENIWTRLEMKQHIGSREFGTWGFDFETDMMFLYAGGHSSYAGNDVGRYHMKTNRWEVTDVYESPLGCCGTNEQYPSGYNFNKRPWVRRHVWNSVAYSPELKRLMVVAATMEAIEKYFYLYDPIKSDWVSRHKIADGMSTNAHHNQVRWTKHGMFDWFAQSFWLFDHTKTEWKKIEAKGTVGKTIVDGCGLVYDSKRDRVLCFTLGGYALPYDGLVYAYDFKSNQIETLSNGEIPKNPAKPWRMYLREMTFIPELDLVLFPAPLVIGKEKFADLFIGYDLTKNMWVTVKLGTTAAFPQNQVNLGIGYDTKRQMIWLGNGSWDGGVWVLKLNPKSLEVLPLKPKFE